MHPTKLFRAPPQSQDWFTSLAQQTPGSPTARPSWQEDAPATAYKVTLVFANRMNSFEPISIKTHF